MESKTVCFLVHTSRGVAQPGSAPVLGTGGRRFKSSHPDHFNKKAVFIMIDCFFITAIKEAPMPNLEITLPKQLSPQDKQDLGQALDTCFQSYAGLDIGLEILFKEYAAEDTYSASDNGSIHCHLFCPRLPRQRKQDLVKHMTETISDSISASDYMIFHISEHPYDNVGVNGQLLSNMIPDCAERKFYYDLSDE